jgi:cob(I)alamin adenosyltransferase
VVIFLS